MWLRFRHDVEIGWLRTISWLVIRAEAVIIIPTGRNPNPPSQAPVLSGNIDVKLVLQSPDARNYEERLNSKSHLQIITAPNPKQRIRKTLEYLHAVRLHYAVVRTPNRLELEYAQGFFVKNGNGSADLKIIARLYKTHVYPLALYLEHPDSDLQRRAVYRCR